MAGAAKPAVAAALSFVGACVLLVYWSASGGGDCAECPKSWDQKLAEARGVTLYGATLLFLLACVGAAGRASRKLLAGTFFAVAGLLGYAFLWIVTSN